MSSQLGTLQLQITANATSATRSLKNLSNALGGLQNAILGVNASNVTSQLQSIGTAMQSITASKGYNGINELSASISKLGGVKVGNAAANIGYLKDALSDLAISANSFTGFDSTSADNITQFAAAIAKLGGVNVQRAAQGMSQLTSGLSNMMATLSKAPQVSQNVIDMTNSLANLASQAKGLAPATQSASGSFNGFFNQFPKHQKKVLSLTSAIGLFYAKFWLIIRAFKSFGKAIDLSSQLTEVQNVIDQTFGNYQKELNSFSKNAIDSYGISELSAKKIASRYQAMSGAMGLSQSKASEMSVSMTKLAADMASFYDVPVSDVAEDLEASYTGLTRPLRKYGLDLTQATLQEWAMRNGMNSNIQSMTQAEKTLLRYNYIMANTTAAQGDFARTADTWHNLMTRLTESFKAFGTIVGGVFINAFKPVLKIMNAVMAKAVQFAKVISNTLGFLFGWKYEEGGGVSDIGDALDDVAGGAADTASGLGDAADNAKKLKDYVMGIDELNILSPDDNSSGGSGGSGGAGGGGASADTDGGQWMKTDSALKDYMSDIKSLWGLGRYISDSLSKAMESIDWNSIYQSARNFGVGLADFLNGLITPQLFGDVGKTIAGCLNTAINAAWAFGVEFNWDNLGSSLASGINGFFNTFDFNRLASAINVFVKGILSTVIKFIDETDWNKIGTEIGGFIAKIDLSGCVTSVGKALAKAIDAGIIVWKSTFNAAPIETTIISAIALLKFTGVGTLMMTTIGKDILKSAKSWAKSFKFPAVNPMTWFQYEPNWNSPASMAIFSAIWDALNSMWNELANSDWGTATGKTIQNMFQSIYDNAPGQVGLAVDAIATLFAVDIDESMKSDKWFNYSSAFEFMQKMKDDFDAAMHAGNIEECGINLIKAIGNGIASSVMFVTEPLYDLINGISESIGKWFEDVAKNGIRGFADGITKFFSETFGPVIDWASSVIKWFTGDGSGDDRVNAGAFSKTASTGVNGFVSGITYNSGKTQSPISAWAKNIITWFTGDGSGDDKINSTSFTKFGNNSISGFSNSITNNHGQSQSPISKWVSDVIAWFTGNGSGEKINAMNFGAYALKSITGFNESVSNHHAESETPIKSWVDTILQKFTFDGKDGGVNDVTFRNYAVKSQTGFNTNIKSDSSDIVMKTWSSSLLKSFWGSEEADEKSGLGKRFYDFGHNIVQGLINGIKSLWDEAIGWLDRLSKKMQEATEKENEIGSPSKVYYRYGRFIDEGFINGIKSMTPDVQSAMANVSAVKPDLTVETPRISGSLNGIEASGTVAIEAVVTSAIANMIDGRIVPTMQQNASDQKELLERIADKDTTINLDGRRVNQQLTRQQSRSGISIRRS